MKVLLVHNRYRFSGGEDAVAGNERRLLEDNGVEVMTYEKFNDDIDDSSFMKRIRLGFESIWSRRTYRDVSNLLRRSRPDVVHVHNLHPQISPSVYAACRGIGVPVVQTLHNYRYICPGALLQRDGRPCEVCVGRLPFPALRYRCFRGSLAATGALVGMICCNRWRGTFSNLVDRYIALTEFSRSRFIAGGIPAGRIEIKPNFLPGMPKVSDRRNGYAVFVGRLSAEKGVRTLLAAWRGLDGIRLKIAGDGPLRPELESTASASGVNVEFLGALEHEQVLTVIRDSRFLVVPSEWYEGFPMVVLEAYACGTPVVASRIGSLAEIVRDGTTGLHFESGNPADLARTIAILADSPESCRTMGENARKLFLERYTAETNFRMLMEIYQRAGEDHARNRRLA